jgi:hypothetical protein
LPGAEAVRGRPFSTHSDLAGYERSILQIER